MKLRNRTIVDIKSVNITKKQSNKRKFEEIDNIKETEHNSIKKEKIKKIKKSENNMPSISYNDTNFQEIVESSKKRFSVYLRTIDFRNMLNIQGDIYMFLYYSRVNYDYDYAIELILKIEKELNHITGFLKIKKTNKFLIKKE